MLCSRSSARWKEGGSAYLPWDAAVGGPLPDRLPELLKLLHLHFTVDRLLANERLGNDIVISLAKCCAPSDAHALLRSLPCRSINAWTALISGYADVNKGKHAIAVYHQMLQDDLEPDHYTSVALLKACGSLANLGFTLHVHHLAVEKAFVSVSFVGNTLIRTYGKCRNITDAEHVFMHLAVVDIVSWNSMLSVYVQNGDEEKGMRLFRQLLEESVSPDNISFVNAFQCCAGLAREHDTCKMMFLDIGHALHVDAQRKGLTTDVYVRSALLSMYGKCGGLIEAEALFTSLLGRDVVTWNAMLSAYVELDEAIKVLQLYFHMHGEGRRPNQQTFVIALQACCVLAEKEEILVTDSGSIKVVSLYIGEALHKDAVHHKDFLMNAFVSNSLITMYGRCGKLDQAEFIFRESSKFEIISWNAMLSAYIEQGQALMALKLYRQLCEEKGFPNDLTFVILFQACGIFAENEGNEFPYGDSNKEVAFQIGQALHADAKKNGVETDTFVTNTLVSMYGKCGRINDAEHVFGDVMNCTIVACNAMLSAYVDNMNNKKALLLYTEMLRVGLIPNKVTFVLLLQACSALAEETSGFDSEELLEVAYSLHVVTKEKGYSTDDWVGSTLVNMYAKYGRISDARTVFDDMPANNVVLWNAMLSAYVDLDYGIQALELYERMQKIRITVTDITLLCVLQACGDAGCLEIGKHLHFSIICVGYDLNLAMGNTLIFAYGNSGSITDALLVFHGLQNHPVVSWNACIAGYAHEGNYVCSAHLFEQLYLEGKEPDDITFLSLLTAYSHAGLVDDGKNFFGFFNRDCQGVPDVKHFGIVIDMLGRAGLLKWVENLILDMPMQPTLSICLCVLSSCKTHGDVKLAKLTFTHAARLYPAAAALYVLMSNIYCDVGYLHELHRINV